MNPWTKQKPTKPGRYMLRNTYNPATQANVFKSGHKLVVYVPELNDTIPMSYIKDDEFEWSELE